MRTHNIASLVATILMIATPGVAHSQTPSSQGATKGEVESDSDPTRPVFLSIRPEFYSISDSVEQRALIVRYDTVALRARRVFHGLPGMILRFELPAVGADVHGERDGGLGDAYGQFLIVPYVKRRFAWVLGSGVVVPTATSDLLGAGKLALAPVIAPLWRFPGGLFYVKVQNFTSVAGDPKRPDVNYLLVTPVFIRVVHQQWWMVADSETKTTWTDDGRTGIKSGFQLGRRVGTGVGLWVKPEVWWGPNRSGRWNLKLGIVWYQRRQSPATAP